MHHKSSQVNQESICGFSPDKTTPSESPLVRILFSTLVHDYKSINPAKTPENDLVQKVNLKFESAYFCTYAITVNCVTRNERNNNQYRSIHQHLIVWSERGTFCTWFIYELNWTLWMNFMWTMVQFNKSDLVQFCWNELRHEPRHELRTLQQEAGFLNCDCYKQLHFLFTVCILTKFCILHCNLVLKCLIVFSFKLLFCDCTYVKSTKPGGRWYGSTVRSRADRWPCDLSYKTPAQRITQQLAVWK